MQGQWSDPACLRWCWARAAADLGVSMYLDMLFSFAHKVSHLVCSLSQQRHSILTCSHWAKGSLGEAYVEKNPLAALQAFAIASGWEQSSFMRRHFLGRALVRRVAKE